MNTRILIAAAGIAGAAGVAGAQSQTAQYHIVFTSPTAMGGNGTNHILLSPALSHVVTAQVMVSFNPGVGQPVNGPGTLTGTVMGLESGGYDLNGNGPSGLGAWAPVGFANLQSPYNFFLGTSAGTVAGYSINDALWAYAGLAPTHPSPENPDNVVTYTFITTPGALGEINFSFPGGPSGFTNTGVWAQGSAPFPFVAQFITNGGPGGTIFFYPSPNVPAVLALAGLIALRRRR